MLQLEDKFTEPKCFFLSFLFFNSRHLLKNDNLNYIANKDINLHFFIKIIIYYYSFQCALVLEIYVCIISAKKRIDNNKILRCRSNL